MSRNLAGFAGPWALVLLGAVMLLAALTLPPPGAARGGGEPQQAAEATEEATEETSEEAEAPVLTGAVGRKEVELVVPDWVQAEIEAEIDPEAAAKLAVVEPGAEVRVYFGTWCSDSKRELSRLWRALDEVGGWVPFDLTYVGVDEAKAEPADLIAGVDLQYVPTLVVVRGGEEVGRIVEEAPGGIERDLLALLTGEARGVISARDDL